MLHNFPSRRCLFTAQQNTIEVCGVNYAYYAETMRMNLEILKK